MADKQLHQADQLGNEQNEREDDKSQERMTYDFENNVAVQDAHGGKPECNMVARLRRRSLLRKRTPKRASPGLHSEQEPRVTERDHG